jgi:acyl-CoA synthetase (AMP-forming)/AMP-acid ligase II
MDIAYLLRQAGYQYARRIAINDGVRTSTFAQLMSRANRLANALAGLGLRPGDCVTVLLTNRIEYAEVDTALALGGYTRVALNIRLSDADFAFSLDESGARALITEALFDQTAAELATQHEVAWLRVGEAAPAGATDYESALARASTAPRLR